MIKSKINIWEEFASVSGGKFIERKENWLSDKVVINQNGWNIFFDYYELIENGSKASQIFTRVIIPFTSINNFKFEIYRTELFDSIAKLFGSQDVTIGYEDFDKEFIVKPNNEHKIKSLLRDSNLRKLIQSVKKVNIQISNQHGIWENNLPKNEYELCLYIEEKVIDFEKLKGLGDILNQILEKLLEINPQIAQKASS